MARFQCISTPLYAGNNEPVDIQIELIDHVKGVELLCKGYDITAEQWPDGYGISNEIITLSSHQGTHVDAPGHYHPQGENISEADIENFMGQAVVFTDLESGKHEVTIDRSTYLWKLDHYANKANAVFFITGAYQLYGQRRYFHDFKGVPLDLVEAALDRDYMLIGTDAFSLDPPFAVMNQRFVETRNPTVLWPTHVLGRRRPYYQLERIYNLRDFEHCNLIEYYALPIRLHCGAAWARAIARIVE